MEQNVDKKIKFKSKIISFYNNNKVLVYSFIFILTLILIFSTILINNKNQQNKIIAEKYVNLNRIIEKAVKKYTRDVKLRKFPSEKNFLNGSKRR